MEATGTKQVFAHWCIVELMGHQRIAGMVTEEALFGGTLMRVDVPDTEQRKGFTKLYGASAIYAITPVEEQVARTLAAAFNQRPVEEWRLAHILPERTTNNDLETDDDDAYSYLDEDED